MEWSHPGRSDQRSQGGYTLVALMVGLTIMAIFMGVAVQTASFQMRREKEAELIFRGEQYVEAIRLYQMKYGRLPMSLKEIWEADPRVIRKKWKDPMTDSYNWGVIFLGQNQRRVQPSQVPGLPTPTPAPTATPGPEGGQGGPGGALASGPGARGPIIGVHSTSCEDSIKIYEGRTRYCDWKFSLQQNPQQGQQEPRDSNWGRDRPIPTPHRE